MKKRPTCRSQSAQRQSSSRRVADDCADPRSISVEPRSPHGGAQPSPRRPLNPSTSSRSASSSLFRVRKFVVVSERKFVVIGIACRQNDRAPVAQSLLQSLLWEVGPISVTDDASRIVTDDSASPTTRRPASLARPHSPIIGERPTRGRRRPTAARGGCRRRRLRR